MSPLSHVVSPPQLDSSEPWLADIQSLTDLMSLPPLSEQQSASLAAIIGSFPDTNCDFDRHIALFEKSLVVPTPDSIVCPAETDAQDTLYHSHVYGVDGAKVDEQQLPSPSTGASDTERLVHDRFPCPSDESFSTTVQFLQHPPSADNPNIQRRAVAPSKRKALSHDSCSTRYPSNGGVSQRHSCRYNPSASRSLASTKRENAAAIVPACGECRPERGFASVERREMGTRRCIPVPLGVWRTMRAPKAHRETYGTVEFWSNEHATGDRVLGTYMADRFGVNTGRSLLSDGTRPFPGKTEKGFNLRVLWPGSPEFSKKMSVHDPLSDFTLSRVRDWVYSALGDFIQASSEKTHADVDSFWRVGDKGVQGVIHLEDLVLVRLRQVSKGTWVPELDVVVD